MQCKNQNHKKPTVFFSNRLELLTEKLGDELFCKGKDPFARRFVLVPHHSLKFYILSYLAQHPKWHIAAGIDVYTLRDGTECLLSKEENEVRFPSTLEISLQIENNLLLFVSDTNKPHIQDLGSLTDYLGIQNTNELSIPLRKKITSLSEELASVFYQYALLSKEEITKWLEKNGWKQWIWKQIFYDEGLSFHNRIKSCHPSIEPIHIFGFPHLPSDYFTFMNQAEASYYFLSPCEMFWEDLCSDKERLFLEKVWEGKKARFQCREQLSFYLKQRNPLLANWGKLGRNLLRKLGETESYLEESYLTSQSPLLLHKIQEQILLLESPLEKITIGQDDRSLYCQSAPSKLREVEALLETLYELMQDENDPVHSKDVLVLCSDLTGYVPYIHMIFGSSTCQIDYCIHGLSSKKTQEAVQALSYFFSLTNERFSLSSIIQCFSWRPIQEKFQWDKKQISLLKRWFEKAHVLWGADLQHRAGILDQPSEERTWESAFDQLLHGLASNLETVPLSEINGHLPSIWPLPIVEGSDAEFLGEFIHVMQCLKNDLKPIYEKTDQTITEWIALSIHLIQSYFILDSHTEYVLSQLRSLQSMFELKPQAKTSYESFHRIIDTILNQRKESYNGSHLGAVRFSALEPGGSYPSKVIYLLGCDEASFPHHIPSSCLDEPSLKKTLPSLSEQERYLFLEILTHARKHLILSYKRIAQKDHKIQNPSFLIQELFSYLDQHFILESKEKPSSGLIIHHPSMHFHHSYFKEGSKLKSYSYLPTVCAQSYYLQEKKPKTSFLKGHVFSQPILHNLIIDLKDLSRFAKHPIKHHFQQKLGIYFDFISDQDSEFFIPYLTKNQLKISLLQNGNDLPIQIAQKKGQLPLGYFGNLSSSLLLEERQEMAEGLAHFGVNPANINRIELSQTCRKKQKHGDRWILPAVQIPWYEGKFVSLVGELDPICPQGLICFGHTDLFHEMIKVWPNYLTFLCIADELGYAEQCLLPSLKKIFSFRIQNPIINLQKYMHYYALSYETASPLKADWALDLLQGNIKKWKTKIDSKSSYNSFSDAYVDWIFKREPLSDTAQLCTIWQEEWGKTFSDLLAHQDVYAKV